MSLNNEKNEKENWMIRKNCQKLGFKPNGMSNKKVRK